MNKKIIAYLEDIQGIRDYAEYLLESEFPNHEIVAHHGKEFIADFRSKRQISDLAVICTDGWLSGTNGWEIMEELRKLGYNGPAIYTGDTPLPEDKRKLYVAQTSKFGSSLIDKIKELIKNDGDSPHD